MASKRSNMIEYPEERTSSDEEDDMLVDSLEQEFIAQQQQQHQSRTGRPRRPSLTNTNSSMDNVSVVTTTRRRGRGPSKRPCLNRNALMARENRQRKKEYIERIENKLQNYQTENQELKETIQKQSNDIKKLTHEVAYLKTVLNNQTMITSLLKAMNDSLGRMHSDDSQGAAVAAAPQAQMNIPGTGMNRSSSDVLNWVVSGQTNSSKTNNMSLPFPGPLNRSSSEVIRDNSRRLNSGLQTINNNPVKIARKTLPFMTNMSLKTEDPPSVESIFEEDEHKQKSSPQSGSFCEYITDKSSAGLDNQLPTTPMSAISNSIEKPEASLSNTDFSQMSAFNVDNFLDNLDDVPNPLEFNQGSPDLFSDETLFHSLDKDPILLTNEMVDPLELSKMSEAINEKTLFQSFDNAGVCLHINSNRVSLEYCSICHLNSLNSEIA